MSAADADDAAALRVGRGTLQFGKLFMWTALHPDVDAPAAAIHALLCSLAREDGETAMPSMEQIGAAFNIKSRTTVRKYLKQLRHVDALDYQQRRTADNWKTRNIYTVHFEPPDGFEGFRTWKQWRDHHFPAPQTLPHRNGRTAGHTDGQKIAKEDQPLPDHEQKTMHSSRTHREETTSSDVCVNGNGAEDDASTSPVARYWDQIRSTLAHHLTPAQRRKITRPEHVTEINERLAALFAAGWTVEGVCAQLQARASVNAQTVRVGPIIIEALTGLHELLPDAATVDPWGIADHSNHGPTQGRRRTNKPEPVPEDHAGFCAFWEAFGHKIGSKLKARESYAKALQHTDAATILTAARSYRAYLAATDTKQCHATTWLNQRRWEDDYTTTTVAAPPATADQRAGQARAAAERVKARRTGPLPAVIDQDGARV